MTTYTTEDIRNIALVGHAGAGKTLLAEAILHGAGAISAMGQIEKGTTVSDFDPQEKRLTHSLESTVVHFDFEGTHINLIDTPGYPDFLGRAISVLPAVETAAVVINAQTGIEMATQRMMETALGDDLCRVIIVNKIDAEDTDLTELMEQIRETFGAECLPVNLPAEDGRSVVDCFFSPSDRPTDFSSVDEAHTRIVDQVVEVDEELMELYLEQGQALTPQQLHDPFEKALREGHLIPVCFVSAQTGAGIPELLDVFVRLMPNPLEGNPPHFMKGEGDGAVPVKVRPDPDAHVVAHVFKVSVDPFIGKMGFFRIHQGTIVSGAQLFIGNARKPFKVAHLYKPNGKDNVAVPKAIPGDICAVAKIDDIHFDAVLHDSHDEDHFHLSSLECPPPMFGLAIRPTNRGDEQKLSDALHKLDAEDPCLHVEHNPTTNETVIRGMGELHLRVLLERMQERYNVSVDVQPPSIAYRETISAAAEGHCRHKKQTGGAGQFGEVFLRVEPLDRGAGYEFLDKVVGGAIPANFITAVEKGVQQVMESGAVAGYPLQDIRVTVYDGKTHPVDSKEIAFVTAGKKALLDAISKASALVLEPIVNLRVVVPAESVGNVTGDLFAKRGRISGTTTLHDGKVVISAEAPLSELSSYQSDLRSMSGGEGAFTMEFSHYDAVPHDVQQKLMNAFSPVVEE